MNHVGTVYTVENLVSKVIRDFHIKLLSEYKHDQNIHNMNNDRVAKLDDEYADIIDILGHRRHRHIPKNSTKRSSLGFSINLGRRQGPKVAPSELLKGR